MKCIRCNREYTNPIPKIRNTKGNPQTEIAAVDYCPNCNRVVMSAVYRNNSAYFDQTLPFGGLSQSTQPEDGKEEFN